MLNRRISISLKTLLLSIIGIIIISCSKSPERYFALSDQAFKEKNYVKAIECLDQAIEINPDYARAYYSRGSIRGIFQDKPGDAIQDLRKAVKIKSGYSEAWRQLGICYSKIDSFSLGVEALNEAIRLKPDFWEAIFARALAYHRDKKDSLAILDYNRVIEISPELIDGYLFRASSYESLGNYENALKDYSKVLEIDSTHTGALGNRWLLYQKMGMKE
ncbi:MAG: tetratricopeptide repeat protein [Candidatus Electryonea clarkiae]|nr:tetratricopeptide repeat protein [Candidatus Electryonea clarkiae]MDP8287881.1 tetratricopeptide repeat protein [Candidatus Electryonea clarkiae]